MRNSTWTSIAALLLFIGAGARGAETKADATAQATASADPAGLEFFESKIRPVLVDNCYSCHSAGAKSLKGKLLLDTRDGILKGGESEQPAIVPGNLDDSTLIRAIRHEDEGLTMPPKKKLPAEQIAAFEQWVKIGAPMPATPIAVAGASPTTKPHEINIAEGKKHWSFQPPREQQVPTGVSAVDFFVQTKLQQVGLSPSPRADKRTLIRRATFDLIGLPPTIAEIEKFEADASPDAFEKLIDRLLASPQYGERWGRYWLDVARYADTKGYVFEEERRYAYSYTYRDWVIRAFNEDLPYDQFLIQQIAADRLDLKDDKRPLAALGFLTLGRRFLNNQPDIIDDRIDVVCRGTMALTVSCARCHDHKYDPIPTADYYSLYGVFASSIEPADLPSIGGKTPAQAAEFEAELAKRKAELESFTKTKHAEYTAAIRTPAQIARYLLAAQKGMSPPELAFETLDDGKSLNPHLIKRWQRYLKEQAEQKDDVFAAWRRYAAIPGDQFAEKSPEVTKQVRAAATENPLAARFIASPLLPPPKTIDEVAERYGKLLAAFASDTPAPDASIESIRLAVRGDASATTVALAKADRLFNTEDLSRQRQLQQKVDELIATHPGAPQRAMAMADPPAPVEPVIFKRGNPQNPGAQVPRQFPAILSPEKREPFKDGSGRLELAKAIASKDNPLTARVIVNRVWQYHFGFGLVRTPSDFGTRGEAPSHPELLDYLALRFVNDDGWSIKKLHKRLMLSAPYQQSSTAPPPADAIAKDPENRLLWRMNPRRLDLEAMRDALLATSGELDLTMGGRSVDILAQPFVPRRTVYAYIDRQNLPGMFRTFDFASPDSTSAQRFSTSVPQQALFMMNSPFVVERSKKLAARAEIKEQPDAAKRIESLYRVALGRTPSKEEIDLGVKFVATEHPPKTEIADKNKSPWEYGYGEFDEASQRLKAFYKLPYFTSDGIWQGGPARPDGKLGWVMLTRDGGHAGTDHAHAAVRRWVAPRDVTVSVAGSISHGTKSGDGVRTRLISSREGLIASWNIYMKSAETKIDSIALKQGETLDFVVDNGRANNVDSDSFSWQVTITKQAAAEPVAGDDTGGSWNSVKEFTGPPATPPNPMTPWEKYAQVLLESNEFVFVD
jgi:hypothetical protein